MEHNFSKQCSVAWFKLAEFVKRGEKERAFELCRLLVHSLDDKAFIKKLEADLCAAFDPGDAVPYYIHAAQLYQKMNNHLEAAATYEQILIYFPNAPEFYKKVIDLYQEEKRDDKVEYYQKELCFVLLRAGKIAKSLALFKTCEKKFDETQKGSFYHKVVITALSHKYADRKIIADYLKKSINYLEHFGCDQEMKQFLAKLQALNNVWYQDAIKLIQSAHSTG